MVRPSAGVKVKCEKTGIPFRMPVESPRRKVTNRITPSGGNVK